MDTPRDFSELNSGENHPAVALTRLARILRCFLLEQVEGKAYATQAATEC